ncbi:MAG: hypothetical protein QOJ83_507 [Frankiales bacterium]|jgi:hypothetical protein|nr:hypothetical protein [Frankiales bacterium]
MRDLDQLVHAMRDEADQLPLVPLLPAVRSGARHLRRRRLASAGGAALAVVAVAAAVMVQPTHGQVRPGVTQSAPDVSALTDNVWYLVSWTRGGATAAPTTDSAPTLAFRDPHHAITDVMPNWTNWSVTIGGGTMHATEGPTTQAAMGSAARTVHQAFSAILPGVTAWAVTGTTMIIHNAAGDRLTFTSDLSAVPGGQVHVRLQARHGAGVTSHGSGLVAGVVVMTAKSGRETLSGTVPTAGGTLGYASPGSYAVTATIKDGVCTPTTVTVRSGRMTELTVSCRDGISTD